MTRRTATLPWAALLVVPPVGAGVLAFPSDRRWAALLPRRRAATIPGVH